MKSLVLCFLAALIAVPLLFGQPNPDTLWTRTYGGSFDDVANYVQQTLDGGYIIAGYTESDGVGGQDFYLLKTNSLGDIQWTHTYGGIGDDYCQSAQQTTDSGYVLIGDTYSFGHGNRDIYLVKTNSLGDTLWTRTYGGSGYDGSNDVKQTSDGGYIICGHIDFYGPHSGDLYLVKIDGIGDTLWTRTFRWGGYIDNATSIQQTSDGGYIVAGYTWLNNWDVVLVKTDSLGSEQWSHIYHGNGGDFFTGIQITEGGGYIGAGCTSSWSDCWLVMVDSLGDTLWTRTYGESSGEEFLSLQKTIDGKYIMAGYTESLIYGGQELYIVKTDSIGDTLWTRRYGGTQDEKAHSIDNTTDGGYIAAGWTESFGSGGKDVYLVKLGSDEVSMLGDNCSNPFVLPGFCSSHIFNICDYNNDYDLSPCTGVLSNADDMVLLVRLYVGFYHNHIYALVDPHSSWDISIALIYECGEFGPTSCLVGRDVNGPGWPELIYVTGLPEGLYYLVVSGYDTDCGVFTMCSDFYLSVELASFEGFAGNREAKLDWVTASETDNDHFYLIRSLDERDYTRVSGDIPATNSASGSSYSYMDGNLINGTTYYYKLVDVDINGIENVNDWIVTVTPSVEANIIPDNYALHQNYPNPFNATTTINYDLKESGFVSLRVFDLLGREVADLVDDHLDAGSHSISWNPSGLSSGIYLYRIETGDFRAVRKLILLK